MIGSSRNPIPVSSWVRTLVVIAAGTGLGLGLAPVAVASPGPVYANCTQAHKAGVYDIPQSDPAYWESGDRDGDGVACESTSYN